MTDKDSRDIVRLEIIGIDIIYKCATGVTNSCWQSNFWKETGGLHSEDIGSTMFAKTTIEHAIIATK